MTDLAFCWSLVGSVRQTRHQKKEELWIERMTREKRREMERGRERKSGYHEAVWMQA